MKERDDGIMHFIMRDLYDTVMEIKEELDEGYTDIGLTIYEASEESGYETSEIAKYIRIKRQNLFPVDDIRDVAEVVIGFSGS